MRARAAALLLGCAAWLPVGCGYTFTAARPSGVRTVAVPVFENTTFSHGLEVQLTDAVIKEVQRRTPWVVVASGSAQTTLSGTITGSALRTMSTSAKTGIVQEQAVELTVDFTWRDASGHTLASRRNFRALESFVPERGTGERIELGQHAAVQELARAIVAELRSAW